MVPLNKIKPNSAKMKKRDGKTVISPADLDQNYFKRDVPLIYTIIQRTAFALSDHIYCNTSLFDQSVINIYKIKFKRLTTILINSLIIQMIIILQEEKTFL